MKLLIATGLYPPDIGGPATYSRFLEQNLPQNGVDVTVVSFGTVRWLPRGIRHIVYLWKLVVRGIGKDIVYALDPVSVGVPGLITAKILRKPFMVRIAGDYAWEQADNNPEFTDSLETFVTQFEKYPLRTRLLKRTQEYVARKAHKVVVPSKYFKGIIRKWGIPAADIRVIYNARSSFKEGASKKVLRELLQFHGTLIISAGRMIPLKGFVELVETLPLLLEEFPDIKLVIAGDGPDRPRIEKKITELKVEERVILTGVLDQQVLFQYIRASDAFILNARHESFANLILEVMEIGTPIIATPTGGTPEMITHRKHGLLVPFGDKKSLTKAISEVLGNRTLADRLTTSASEHLKKFNVKEITQQLIGILKNVARKRS